MNTPEAAPQGGALGTHTVGSEAGGLVALAVAAATGAPAAAAAARTIAGRAGLGLVDGAAGRSSRSR